jgi:hypothetical protein
MMLRKVGVLNAAAQVSERLRIQRVVVELLVREKTRCFHMTVETIRAALADHRGIHAGDLEGHSFRTSFDLEERVAFLRFR